MTKVSMQDLLKNYWALLKEKRFSQGELLLREKMQQFPPGTAENTLIKANLADILLRQGKLQEARETAMEALFENPNQVRALTVLGLVSLQRKDSDEAIDHLEKAYRLKRNAYQAGRLARAYEAAGSEKQALAVLREALEESPRDQFLLKQYTRLRKKCGPAAERDELLSRFSAEEETSLLYAEYIEGNLQKLGPEKAAAELERIMKVGKRSSNPHLNILMGNYRRRLKQEQEAAQSFRRARELDPDNHHALAQEAFCYRRLAEKEKSWPLLKMLLSREPGNSTVKSTFVKDAAELGKRDEAVHFLEELLDSFPHHKELYGSINKLKKSGPES